LTKGGPDIHVHYGSWPLNGFYRLSCDGQTELGGSPITVDLLVKDGVYQEKLILMEETGKGGTWSCTVGEQDAEGKFDNKGIATAEIVLQQDEGDGSTVVLKVTGAEKGTIPLTITYTETNGAKYEIRVSVHVTAEISLRPSTVYMFPDDSVTVKLSPLNAAGEPLDGGLSIESVTSSTLTATPAEVEVEPGGGGEAPKAPGVTLTTIKASGPAAATVDFTYTVPGKDKSYSDGDTLDVQVIEPWKMEWTAEEDTGKTICTITIPEESDVVGDGRDVLSFAVKEDDVKIANADVLGDKAPTLNVKPDGTGAQVELAYGADMPEVPVELKITLTMTSMDEALIPAGEAQTHTLTLTVAPPEEDNQADTKTAAACADALPPTGPATEPATGAPITGEPPVPRKDEEDPDAAPDPAGEDGSQPQD